jgi:thioredoxin reductase/ferredoxin
MPSLFSFLAVAALALACVVTATIARRRRAARPRTDRLKLVHAINDDRCVGCDACVDVCPTEVLELVGNKSRVVRFDDCIQCEQCALVCPTTALVMHLRGETPPPVLAPELDRYYQAAQGLYLIGEAAGKPLVKNASNLGRVVVEHMLKEGLRPTAAPKDGDVDVLIVGSGPGGLSAALTCLERGLSYVVLEKDALVASTIANYPKGKHVMAEPYDVRCLGPLPVFDATKEELLAGWLSLLEMRGVAVQTRHTVEKIERRVDGSFEVRASDGSAQVSWRARRVVLAIGTRGTPRKLGVPGEHLDKVSPLLRDADLHRGQNVLVVGGGDSAVEAAVALGQTAQAVTLSYRGKTLSRCKAKNRQALDRAAADGRVRVIFGSNVTAITPATVVLGVGGATSEMPNDHVFLCIGGDPPTRWLGSLGVRFSPQPHMFARPASDALVESLVGPQRERQMRLAQAAAAAALLLATAFGAAGCLTDLVPLPSGAPAASAGNSQPAGLDLDGGVPNFNPGIMKSVQMLGCPGCHNGGTTPMTLIASPATPDEWTANYMDFSARAMDGAMSLVLAKNLQGSGLSHVGGAPFASTSDPTYQAWLAWITAGAPQ